ncbi:MAG: hypothetical protein MUP04_01495 [Anaerolineae bacterium]|nr:hypothetical protein [Anaerolineae bacterium]
MKAEIRRVVGLLPLMLLSMALLSLLVQGSGVLAYRSFQSPQSPTSPPPNGSPSPTATAIPPTETPTPAPTETPAATETPTPMLTETPAATETPLPSPIPTFEAAPPAAVASPIPPAEESPSQPPPSRSWAGYIKIGLVALAYTWRTLGVLAFVAFLGLVMFLAIGRWRR